MSRLRLLVWLLAVMALVAPPAMSSAAMAWPAEPMAFDCADHPPADACPTEDSAKHAAGTCCPTMSGVEAVLATTADVAVAPARATPAMAAGPSLVGRPIKKEPPPPRV